MFFRHCTRKKINKDGGSKLSQLIESRSYLVRPDSLNKMMVINSDKFYNDNSLINYVAEIATTTNKGKNSEYNGKYEYNLNSNKFCLI